MTLLTPSGVDRPESSGTATPATPPRPSRLPLADLLRPVVATASVGAAAIHFAVLPEHWQEWVLAGLFFGVLAWLQVGWAAAVMLTRSRLVLAVGALAQLGVVVLWIVTRTVGLPFGPEAGEPEGAGVIDAICSGLEVVAGLGALLLLTGVARRVLRTAVVLGSAAVLLIGTAGATTAALVPSVGGGHEHEHSDAGGTDTAASGHTHSGAAVTGAIPAGWVAGCHSHATAATTNGSVDPADIGHAPGNCTDATVTVAQRSAAERLVADTTGAVANRFPTLQSAKKAGYIVINQTGPLVHVGNPAYFADGHMLDPQRVESLVYASFGRGSMLLGAMYVAEPTSPQGPLIGGALTSWHIHTNLCVDPTRGTALNPRADGSCAPGSAIGPTPQMLHVWTIPYQGGPFADISTPALITAVTSELQRRATAGGRPS